MKQVTSFCLGFLWIICLQAEPSMHRGAQLFKNYCSGCHALRYVDYAQMQQDLGLQGSDNIDDLSRISLPEEDAQEWFGQLPPDLSLSSRQRGASWLSTYLKGFYNDPTRPFGVNNHVFPNVSMPNCLAPLQASLTQVQFNQAVDDIVVFLAYAAEPIQNVRLRIGKVVVIFLGLFWMIVYQLKRYYWKKLVN
jgi:ubiquinol-cytochrome c reductase cytochrome c1 subunit